MTPRKAAADAPVNGAARALEAGGAKLAHLTALATNRVEVLIDPAFTPRRFYRMVTPQQP
jgi:hypothetical protein